MNFAKLQSHPISKFSRSGHSGLSFNNYLIVSPGKEFGASSNILVYDVVDGSYWFEHVPSLENFTFMSFVMSVSEEEHRR